MSDFITLLLCGLPCFPSRSLMEPRIISAWDARQAADRFMTKGVPFTIKKIFPVNVCFSFKASRIFQCTLLIKSFLKSALCHIYCWVISPFRSILPTGKIISNVQLLSQLLVLKWVRLVICICVSAPFPLHPHQVRNKENGIHLWRRMWGRWAGDGEAPGGVRTHSSQIFTTLTNGTKMHQFSLLMGQKTFWQWMNMGILSHSPPSGFMLFGNL